MPPSGSLMATRADYEVGADGDVVPRSLPLTRNMIILSAFLRRAFGDLIGDFCHIAVVAGEQRCRAPSSRQ